MGYDWNMKNQKHAKSCIQCKGSFRSSWSSSKYCSKQCKTAYYKLLYGRGVIASDKLPTGTVGAMVELIVSTDLMKKGYSVFRALSPSCSCDLIVLTTHGSLIEIEVKTGYETEKNRLIFPRKKHREKEGRLYAIWERNTGEIFYLSQKNLDKQIL